MAEGGGLELSLPFTEHYLLKTASASADIFGYFDARRFGSSTLLVQSEISNPMVRFGWTGLQVTSPSKRDSEPEVHFDLERELT